MSPKCEPQNPSYTGLKESNFQQMFSILNEIKHNSPKRFVTPILFLSSCAKYSQELPVLLLQA
jgi:hypothetical protein